MRNRAPAGYASISNDRIGGFGSRNCYNATGNHGNRITHQAEQRSHRFVDHTARDRDRSWRVRSGSVSMQSAAVEVRERLLHDRGRRIDATVVWSRLVESTIQRSMEVDGTSSGSRARHRVDLRPHRGQRIRRSSLASSRRRDVFAWPVVFSSP